jgi:hypothetical protein
MASNGTIDIDSMKCIIADVYFSFNTSLHPYRWISWAAPRTEMNLVSHLFVLFVNYCYTTFKHLDSFYFTWLSASGLKESFREVMSNIFT